MRERTRESNDVTAVCASLAGALRAGRHMLVISHVNPDGDAVGSAVAMAHIGLHLGVETRILLVSGVPSYLSWLALPVPVVRTLDDLGDWRPDLAVFVDCGDLARAGLDRAGQSASDLLRDARILNIDHHISNPGFGDLNWVEPSRSATGELVGLLAEHLGLSLSGDLGEALYLALVSDTGDFSYANTTPACFAMASRIMDAGLDMASFTERYVNTWTLSRLHLWGRLLSEVSLHEDGAVAVSVVPRQYLEELGLKKEDLEGFASWLRKLRGVRVGLFIREDGRGLCKISLRSMGDVDVREVAALYGGGGHAAAAGAELSLPPAKVAERVLREISKRL